MKLNDSYDSIFTAFVVAAWALNIVWFAILALPISWLWNWAVVPLVNAPKVGYFQALGILVLWFLLRISQIGISAKPRE